MCNNCFNEEIDYFISESEFQNFEKILDSKILSKKLFFVENKPSDKNVGYRYQCNSCGQVWVLSNPDYAWRGYFKKIESFDERNFEKEKMYSPKVALIKKTFIAIFIIALLIWLILLALEYKC